ncbi:MAG: PhoU domain-containing protein, partial [Lachnospiraceae bacterium]|nr:PhoU domain-containing protein [Lachnospiraceae bacterium]
ILGCNIGSCVSALLASLNGKKDAKRAAMIHFLFNVIGSAIMFVVILIFSKPITGMLLSMSGGNVARAVANTHSLMKIIEVAMLFPFMGGIVKLTYKVVPGEDKTEEDGYELTYIKQSMMSPTTALMDAIHEIEHMGKVAMNNLTLSMHALCEMDGDSIEKVYKTEKYIDFMNNKITDYLVKVNELELPTADSDKLAGLFHVVNDIERIGDHAENLADAAKERIESNIELSEKAIRQMKDMMASVEKLLEYAIDMFTNGNQKHMREILELEDAIDKQEKKLHRAHIKRLTKNKCTPEAGMIFTDAVSGLERVADHGTNIAFAIMAPNEYVIEEEEE